MRIPPALPLASFLWVACIALSCATVAVAAVDHAPVLNVRECGAAADGKTVCTVALQSAIDRAAAAGGGTVYFPAGCYLSGTLVLKSHVTLHLDDGATLLGSPDQKDYPALPNVVRSYTDHYVRQALLAGENLEHVTLRGRGTIDGNGGAFHWKEYLNRPFVIRLVQCHDVLVEGLTLQASPMWMQHYLACDRVQIRGLRVFNHGGYNSDGMDLDACHDVAVSDCFIDTDDDALCLKSTLDRACENVTVTNCVLSSHANAFKLGTESHGGFRNIAFTNSAILSPRFTKATYGIDRGLGGIALETVDGGRTENLTITNITIQGVNVPLFVRLGNRARPIAADGPKPPMGSMRNVSISHIIATRTGRVGCSITGLPDAPVQNVSITDVNLEFEGGGKREWTGKEVPERADAYPESKMFGDLPAYGFYSRHVDGLKLEGVRLATLSPDARHAIVCDDVRDFELVGLNVPVVAGSAEIVRFINVVDAMVRGARLRQPAEVFLKLDGERSGDVVLLANDFTKVGRLVVPGAGVAAGAWTETGNATRSSRR